LDQIQTPWVLALDADYIIGDDFAEELKKIYSDGAENAWYVSFHYVAFGKRLSGTLYPPRALLFKPKACRYEQDGHTQLLHVRGASGTLQTRIDHDDRKPLSRWLDAQRKYAEMEADKLNREIEVSTMPDRVRKMIWPAAPATFLYTLFAKRLIFDGWPGVFYSLQRTYAELLLSLELLERKLTHRETNKNSHDR
jgi:hypothetical protein